MKIRSTTFLLLTCLFIHFEAIGQIKNITLKHVNPDAEYNNRTFKVMPLKELTGNFHKAGKMPGKPELAFMEEDKTGKLNFVKIVRFWSKRKNVQNEDDYNLRLLVNTITPPKEYTQAKYIETYFKRGNDEIIFIREYETAFNTFENDTINMVQVIYITKNKNFKNEVIICDMIEIGRNVNKDNTLELFNKFTALITPHNNYFNKKWSIEAKVDLPFGFNSVPLDLSYVIKDVYGYYNYYRITMMPGNLTGGGFTGARHIKRNFWVNMSFVNYGGNDSQYDSLYKRGEYDKPPVMYDVKLTTTSITNLKIGAEKRFLVGKYESIDVTAGFIYGFQNSLNFEYRNTKGGALQNHTIEYKGSPGYEFGFKYRHLFSKHNFGVFIGMNFFFQEFKYKSYYNNNVSQDISTAPYFLNRLNNNNISGAALFFGGTYQF